MYQLERDPQEKEANEEDGIILAWKMSEFNLKCRRCFSVTTSSSIKPAEHSKGLCVSFAENREVFGAAFFRLSARLFLGGHLGE